MPILTEICCGIRIFTYFVLAVVCRCNKANFLCQKKSLTKVSFSAAQVLSKLAKVLTAN